MVATTIFLFFQAQNLALVKLTVSLAMILPCLSRGKSIYQAMGIDFPTP
ncbi:hypothetical protein L195_g062261 [Trifolium pratense]|uniref:Uncharacterized protein n=1 Tax=Trifolium pratense TaxID=57577 RepID=A0A2K3KEP3_TRIPR|nr:hypothetical protein L195_g062261 [Trifolium pratense]